MRKRLTTQDFIKRCNEIHNHRYDYSKTSYTLSHSNITITCPVHGDFEQKAYVHLQGHECKLCSHKVQGSKNSLKTKDFIARANKIHNHKYDYTKTKYVHGKEKLTITCPIHGDFEQIPNSHLRGTNCFECGKVVRRDSNTKSVEEYLREVNIKHNYSYGYEKVVYINSTSDITITCKYHGDFTQKAYVHSQGHGCPTCAIKVKGWTKTDFKNQCIKNNNGLGILYVIRCFNDTESFYKVGITSRSIEDRFINNTVMPYNYNIIHRIEDDPNNIYDLEHEILRGLKNTKYKPFINFSGSTECFNDLEYVNMYLFNI